MTHPETVARPARGTAGTVIQLLNVLESELERQEICGEPNFPRLYAVAECIMQKMHEQKKWLDSYCDDKRYLGVEAG